MSTPTAEEVALVAELLGRAPEGAFQIVVRRPSGAPVVLENAPYLHDGRPMPTRFWLVDPSLRAAVSRLEAAGGVDAAERAVDPAVLAAHHAAIAAARDATLGTDDGRPRPSGGVAGTRVGVKCLHAHLAHFLATGDDPVGAWTAMALADAGTDLDDVVVDRG